MARQPGPYRSPQQRRQDAQRAQHEARIAASRGGTQQASPADLNVISPAFTKSINTAEQARFGSVPPQGTVQRTVAPGLAEFGAAPPAQQSGPFGLQLTDPLTGAPPTGLIGSENALIAGATGSTGAVQEARDAAVASITQASADALAALRATPTRAQGVGGIQAGGEAAQAFLAPAITGFDPLVQQGGQAGNVQAALSGALGVEAQQAALANLQPVDAFLQAEGSRAVMRNASATGGLQGGNVLKELTRFGQGLAGQSAQQQFANLGTVADRGFGALQGQATLAGQQGDVATQTGRDVAQSRQLAAQLAAQQSRDIASSITGTALDTSRVQTDAANQLAQIFGGTGQSLAAGRTATGQGIAGAIGETTSALANLANQQGAGISDISGVAAGNLASILQGAGASDAISQEQLAALLANISTGQASQVAGLPSSAQFIQPTDTLGNVATLAGGVGGILEALK